MRKVLLLLLSISMVIMGAYFIFTQLFFSPVIYLKILVGSFMLVFLGLFLLWEDFIVPIFKSLFNLKEPNEGS